MKVLRNAKKNAPEASQKICDFLEQWKVFQEAKNILFFAPLPGEVDLLLLAQKALDQGKKVVFPRVLSREKGIIGAYSVQSLKELKEESFGILEPKPEYSLDPKKIDLLFIPALGLDLQGNRLGFGGGFYDRFLPYTSGRKVGVIFSEQTLPHLSADSWDIPLDKGVSEKGFFL